MTIKEDYNKIIEGCGNAFCGYYPRWGTKNKIGDNLCPSCQKAKEVFLQRCKDELERREGNKLIEESTFGEVNSYYVLKEANEKEISQLKEVLELGK